MRDLPLPITNDLASLRAFGNVLRCVQREKLGPLTTALYGDRARDMVAVEALSPLMEETQRLPPRPEEREPEKPEYLRVIVVRISDGETIGGYLFHAQGGSITRPPGKQPSDGSAPMSTTIKTVASWEKLAQSLLQDIATACTTPLFAIAKLAKIGHELTAADAIEPRASSDKKATPTAEKPRAA